MPTASTPTVPKDRPDGLNTVGTYPTVTGLKAEEFGHGPLRMTQFTFTNVSMISDDNGVAGAHASQKLYDFPNGLIRIVGAATNLTLLAGSGGIADGAVISGGIGSVAASVLDALLTSTEASVVPSTDTTLVGGAGTFTGKSVSASITALTDNSAGTANNTVQALADGSTYANDVAAIRNNFADLAAKINELIAARGNSVTTTIDGTSSAGSLYLNFITAAADSSADDTITVNGTITVCWINLGDS